MPRRRWTWLKAASACVVLLWLPSCDAGTRGPSSACKVLRPIDLTARGWAALDAADPEGAAMIDALNDWYDRNCPHA